MTWALFQPTCTGAPLGWSTSYWLMLANHVLLILVGVAIGAAWRRIKGEPK